MHICEAVAAGDIDAVRAALDAGADVNARCMRGSALIQAVVNGHREVAALLIERGARVDVDDFDSFTAYCYAVGRGDWETARLLMERGVGATREYLNGELLESPLYGDERGLQSIDLLVSLGADLSSVDRYGDGLLIRAARQGCPNMVAWLLEHGLAMHRAWSRGRTAIQEARLRGHERVVTVLERAATRLKPSYGVMQDAEGAMDSLNKILYDDLTWPEINEAIQARKVLLLPIGSTEQHGPHLPLDVDNFLARNVCLEAAKLAPPELLVMPTIPYGYNEHALDFPGTINVHYQHFIEYCLDVCKSVAHAGFDRVVLVDGHGSNEHLCEFIARRATLETDGLFASTMWTNLVAEEFNRIRSSPPGGAAHACELETSAYLYLDESRVQMDRAEDHYGGAAGKQGSPFLSVDLAKPLPPIKLVQWTSSATPTGVSGAPTLATKEKGRALIETAARSLLQFTREFRQLKKGERIDHRVVKPALPTLPSTD